MILCINCSAETKLKMDTLLKQGHYRDYSELIAIAIENLWVLNHEIAEKGAIVIDETFRSHGRPAAQGQKATHAVTFSKQATPQKPPEASSMHELSSKEGPLFIPDLFRGAGLEALSVRTLDIQSEKLDTGEVFTVDRWLFGQYNKLLPIKVSCRALARLSAKDENGVPLERVTSIIAESAASLGDYLSDHDRRHLIGRDDALATAFPRSGKDTEKSRIRYANQFVGSVNSIGQLSGLLWDYRMACLVPEDKSRLRLTEQGLKLAQLTNPILDGHQAEPVQKFSVEEIAFLLGHIRSFIPVEEFTFRTLLRAIGEGANTPGKLDEALRPLVPGGSNRSLSPSFLTSQRSGALSRMADLGLISRIRKGVKVSYAITEQGHTFTQANNQRDKERNDHDRE